jgi:hypothetical protein
MLTAQACYIEQRQENAFAIVNDGVAAGQNFIACETGMITEIGVRFATVGENTNKLQLQMATGSNTLSPEYTQEFQVKEAGDLLIQLLTPFPVEEGQQYAFTIFGADNPDASANLAGFNGNPYPNGNFINETDGVVTNFGADATFSLTIVKEACVIDQAEDNAFANIASNIATGQTFIPCTDGILTTVRFNFVTMDAARLRLQIAAGPNTLEPDYTQIFDTEGTGDQIIELVTPFPVTAGTQYAITVSGIEGEEGGANMAGFNGNPYPNGNFINEVDGVVTNFGADADFSMTIVEDACVIDQDQANAFWVINENVAAGQVFEACGTGMLSEIRVNFIDMNAQNMRLQFAQGSNTLSPTYIQDFFTGGQTGDVVIKLTEPIFVEAGQTYAYTVIAFEEGSGGNMLGFNGNPYANGLAINQSNGSVTNFSSDMDFSVTIVEGPPPTSTQEVVTDNNLLRLHDAFPNPAFNQITIPFYLAEATETRIEIYTLNGKLVKSIDLGLLPNGEYQELVSINDLPNGLYLYGILTPEGRLMSKITVQH